MKHVSITIVAFGAWASAGAVAHASVIYEDVSYFRPNGVTEINPVVPPIDALVKIQETVYDDVQGQAIIAQQLALGLINGPGGPGLPAGPINLYTYSITNLNYGSSPFTPGGNGVSGFNIPGVFGIPYVAYAPNFANSAWEPAPGNSGPGNFEWDINADGDQFDGDGVGILLGQTHNSFYLVVPDGTPHGFIPGTWVHSWNGEQPGGFQIDTIFGTVSGPVPTPGTMGLMAAAGLLGFRRRR